MQKKNQVNQEASSEEAALHSVVLMRWHPFLIFRLLRHPGSSRRKILDRISKMDHIVPTTLRYPAAIWTTSSGRSSSPVPVWHADKNAKSEWGRFFAIISETSSRPSWALERFCQVLRSMAWNVDVREWLHSFQYTIDHAFLVIQCDTRNSSAFK